jgi:hypothetical protein
VRRGERTKSRRGEETDVHERSVAKEKAGEGDIQIVRHGNIVTVRNPLQDLGLVQETGLVGESIEADLARVLQVVAVLTEVIVDEVEVGRKRGIIGGANTRTMSVAHTNTAALPLFQQSVRLHHQQK